MEIQKRIEEKVRAAFAPTHLEVQNESSMHNVAPGSETHFRLRIVSASFAGQTLVERHQQVYRVLAEEKAGPVHALGLQTLTPEEWEKERADLESPPCLGGNGSLS